MKTTKKINGVFTEIEITSDMEEFKKASYVDQRDILQKELSSDTESLDDLFREKYIKDNIEIINNSFDKKIDDYLSKYSKNEISAFTQKKIEALIVIWGWESAYITGKATAFGITPKEFASIIIAKNEEYTKLYIALENEKDLAIQELTANLK